MLMTAQAQNEMHSNVVSEESTVSINMDAFCFEALSGRNLYKNMIRAIVRELSCNAADSHTMAGNTAPFYIHLPTVLEPHFSIRDYGIGLDDNGVRKVYMTYFGSTKRDSEHEIGAWGLGSKSPLGYVDNFTVSSFKDGIKRVYMVYKNDKGIPSIKQMVDDEATTEPNGLEVMLPVLSNDDIRLFTKEARQVLVHFPVMPTLNIDIEMDETEYMMVLNDGIKIINTNGYNSKVIHGCIEYPIDRSTLRDLITNKAVTELMYNASIEITLPLGAIEFSLSREELSYTPKTVKAIEEKVMEALELMYPIFKTEMDNIDADFDKYLKLVNATSYLRDSVRRYIADGHSALHSEAHNYFTITSGSMVFNRKRMRRTNNKCISKYVTDSVMPTTHMTIVVNDTNVVRNIKGILLYNFDKLSGNEVVVVPNMHSLQQLYGDGMPECAILFSSLEMPVREKKSQVKAEKGKVPVLHADKRFSGSYSVDAFGDTVLYVEYDQSNKESVGRCTTSIKDIFNTNVTVVGISKTNIKKIQPTWIKFHDYFNTLLNEKVADGVKYYVPFEIEGYLPLLSKYEDVSVFASESTSTKINNHRIKDLALYLGRQDVIDAVSIREEQIYDAKTALLAKYPLLNHIERYHTATAEIEIYIKAKQLTSV